MSSRFVTNVVLALFGGFVVVMSRTVGPSAIGWIAFAFGIGVVAISLLAQLDRARGLVQRAMDGAMVALGGLSIAFGLLSSGAVERWTAFAFALGWVGTALAGLTAHEVAQWRTARGLGQLHWLPAGRGLGSRRSGTAPAADEPRVA